MAWKQQFKEAASEVGLELKPTDIRTDELIIWRNKNIVERVTTPLAQAYQANSLSQIHGVRLNPLLALPQMSNEGNVEILFKNHKRWKLVLPTLKGASLGKEDLIISDSKQILAPIEFITSTNHIGGLLSIKRSVTEDPSAKKYYVWVFSIVAIRGAKFFQPDKTVPIGESKGYFLSKANLAKRSESDWPNLDVYRALELLLPGQWSGLRPFSKPFDFALSFGREDRNYAEELYKALRRRRKPRKPVVFYDKEYDLAGQHLPRTLNSTYSTDNTHFAVPLISKNYKTTWAKHEFRSMIGDMIRDLPKGFVIPVILDGVDPSNGPDLKTIRDFGYIRWDESGGETGVAERLMSILNSAGLGHGIW